MTDICIVQVYTDSGYEYTYNFEYLNDPNSIANQIAEDLDDEMAWVWNFKPSLLSNGDVTDIVAAIREKINEARLAQMRQCFLYD